MQHLNRFILSFIVIIFQISLKAQCAMCKAGAEQSLEKGSTSANWINYAILFLMTIPLLLIFGIFLLYRYNNKRQD